MRSVAGTEEGIIGTSISDGHTAKVSANGQYNDPSRVHCALLIRLWVLQLRHWGVPGIFNLGIGSVTHEHGLSSPGDGHSLPTRNLADVDLESRDSEHISGGAQTPQEAQNKQADTSGEEESRAAEHEICELALIVVALLALWLQHVAEESLGVRGLMISVSGSFKSAANKLWDLGRLWLLLLLLLFCDGCGVISLPGLCDCISVSVEFHRKWDQ